MTAQTPPKKTRRQIREEKLEKHNICPDHGIRHLLVPDLDHPSQTGMCAHPTCIDKVISSTMHIRLCGGLVKFCRKLDRDRGENEFTSFVTQQLLMEVKKNKPTVMNPHFMRWTALSYLAYLKKEEDREKTKKQIFDEIDGLLETEEQHLIYNYGIGIYVSCTGDKAQHINPEKAFAQKEIMELSIKEFGRETHLWLMRELTDLDYMKITGLSAKELPRVKDRWKKWYTLNISGNYQEEWDKEGRKVRGVEGLIKRRMKKLREG